MFLFKGLSQFIWALSLSTFFLNLSSTIVFVSMPLFLRSYFGTSASQAGSLEGVAEGLSLLTRAGVGIASDFARRRKGFILLGYLVSFVARVLLAVGNVFSFMVIGRFLDKVGNGVQASPREAFISDVTPKEFLGKAYGLNKALGVIGSVLGSILLLIFFKYCSINLRILFYISVALTGLSIVCLVLGVRDVSSVKHDENAISFRKRLSLIYQDICQFRSCYWIALTVIFLFKLGYFSGAFLMMWLDQQNFDNFFGIMLSGKSGVAGSVVMIIQNVFCAVLSYPMGVLSDRVDRRYVTAMGMICMLISLTCLGLAENNKWLMLFGIIFYGIQMSMQGALMALLSVTMPDNLKGTGFGIFFLTSGIGVIIANQVIMRGLWESCSASTAFLSIIIPITLALTLVPCIRLQTHKKIS